MQADRNLGDIRLKSENTEYDAIYLSVHLISISQNTEHFSSVYQNSGAFHSRSGANKLLFLWGFCVYMVVYTIRKPHS